MKKPVPAIFVIAFFLLTRLYGQQEFVSHISDGPYIFREEKKAVAKWIDNGIIKKVQITPRSFNTLKETFSFRFGYHDMLRVFNVRPDYKFSFRGVDSIAVISDIHGEFGKYIDLLRSQGVIDAGNNWNFGKGHLVILGDCFDRGDQVTELLWHIFGLEKQAKKAGGMVHYVLGNHEIMVLGEDLRYVNEKYRKVEEITGIRYQDLFSSVSVLGIWLRSKPVMISINNLFFVHAGISTDLVRKRLHIDEINHLFYQMQVSRQVESERDIMNLVFLNGELGPLWYRGYFDDENFTAEKADSVLNYVGKDHIIVGHTTFTGLEPRYGKKIIGVDAGIGYNRGGAMLIIKEGAFFGGTPGGKREKL